MNPLRTELQKVVSSGRFTTVEAKRLMGLDWRSLARELPTPLRNEAEDLYHLILGSIEEVAEGYVEDRDDPEMRARIEKLLHALPK